MSLESNILNINYYIIHVVCCNYLGELVFGNLTTLLESTEVTVGEILAESED